MREVQEILRLWQQTEEAGDEAILATVVKTRGSSYRLPGARLLLTKTGDRAGSVSGGCLEGDLVKKSWWLTESGSSIRRYDTNADGEIESGYGLGCNGIIHVLIERLKPGRFNILRLLRRVRSERQPVVVCRFLSPVSMLGERLTIDPSGQVEHDLDDASVAAELERRARLALVERTTGIWREGECEVFIETLVPPARLLIFGAGEDVPPLVKMAALLGWQIHIFDGRPQYARPERFPEAHSVVVRPVGSALDSRSSPIPIDEWTVAVLMTHSYSQDLDVLNKLAARPPRYVGLLGPRKRSLRLLADAGLAEDHFDGRLYGPMGLDIGADGPEQVALAVMGEIQGVINGRSSGPLRERHGSIHSSEEADSSDVFSLGSIACA